jgi:peroxiredoxin
VDATTSRNVDLSTRVVPERLLASRTQTVQALLAPQVDLTVWDILEAEIGALIRAGVGANARRIGDSAPNFVLTDRCGKRVVLSRLEEKGPVVLLFFRGRWCPFCDLQLRAYQEVLPDIRALGGQLLALSPQTPTETAQTADERKLEFPVLSDSGNRVARTYGIVFSVSTGLRSVHQRLGTAPRVLHGGDPAELPAPSVFVVGSHGRVAFSFVNADFRVRLDPGEVLRRLEVLKVRSALSHGWGVRHA